VAHRAALISDSSAFSLTYQGWKACFLACRSRCVELNAGWTHPCWTWHPCFQETVEYTSF